jgi:hypothetical protein
MKQMVILLMVLLVASVACAQDEYVPNLMCVSFDPVDMVPCLNGISPNTFVPVYLCLVNPDFETIKGFECTLTINGNFFASPPILPEGSGITPAFGDNYIIGFTPFPAMSVNILMEIPLLYFSGPLTIDLGPSVPSNSIQGLPMVAVVDEGGAVSLVDTQIPTVGGLTVASINNGDFCFPIVDTETVNFDSIKSLYR